MADSEDTDSSHIKLHQINSFPQGSLVKAGYQPKVIGGTAAVIVSSANTHLQTTSTQVSRISTLPIQAGPTANYHVPRGAATVANLSAPRSSVATPVVRGPPQPLPIGARGVLPAGVQPPRQSAKMPAHHVGAMRNRGVTVASKQQQVVSGRLSGPMLVAATRPPHSTIITSTGLTKPVVLSNTTMVRGGIAGQATAKIYQATDSAKIYQQTDHSTTTPKIYQQTDQSTTTAKIYQQSDQSTTTAKIYQQSDQSTTTKLYQTDQSTSTTTKHYQTPEGATLKVYQTTDQPSTVTAKLYHHSDQSTTTNAKLFSQSEQSNQPTQPIYIHHKPPHIVSGGVFVSQTGAGAGGVVVASGVAQSHSTVMVPHGTQHGTVVQQHGAVVQQVQTHSSSHIQPTHGAVVSQQHGAAVLQSHGTAQPHGAMMHTHSLAQQHSTAVLQPQTHLQQQHGSTVQTHASLVQQHGSTVQTHASLVQQHGAVVHQTTHTGVSHQTSVHQSSLHQSSVQSAHMNVPQSQHNIISGQAHTANIQPGSQTSYIEISRQMVRPVNPSSQGTTATAIHQQSTVSQVMRFNPVVVVEAGRPQPFQGILSGSTGGGSSTEGATLTALPAGVAQGIVQPLSQGITIAPSQPVSAHHPLVSVAQQVSVNTSIGQITTPQVPQSLAVGSLTVTSISQPLSAAVAQSLTPKQNTSPRPSILRKRDPDSWSGSMKAQRNLGPVLSGLNVVTPTSVSSLVSASLPLSNLVQTPVTPQSQTVSAGDDDAPPGSGGSSTLSAASSPDATPVEQPSPAASISTVPAASSPRKKPRKQQLPHNPPPSRPSPFSDEDMQFLSDKPHSNSKSADYSIEEDKKKRMSLLKSYRQGWKPTQNHFMRYGDVRTREEKKPTLSELANQKNALHIINGWKIYHLLTQIEDMVNTETEHCDLFTSLLTTMEEKQQKIRNKNPDKKTDELLSRLNERIKANAQRCKVVNDHMHEAKGQFMKLFEHKNHVSDLINRFANKRSIKKRERV